jgi:hypothetical protein
MDAAEDVALEERFSAPRSITNVSGVRGNRPLRLNVLCVMRGDAPASIATRPPRRLS